MNVIVIIGRLNYVQLVNDDDIVPFSTGPLKLGLMSHQYEDRSDPVNAALYFGPNFPEKTGRMAGAIDLLDKEKEEESQGEVHPLSIPSDFGAGGIYSVR